jgi:hypothetical protein
MSRHNPYNIQLQISRLFQQGQSFFAPIKVQDWLRERGQNPADYDIKFHQQPAPPGSQEVIQVQIELKRKDGQPTDAWLQQELNQQS